MGWYGEYITYYRPFRELKCLHNYTVSVKLLTGVIFETAQHEVLEDIGNIHSSLIQKCCRVL